MELQQKLLYEQHNAKLITWLARVVIATVAIEERASAGREYADLARVAAVASRSTRLIDNNEVGILRHRVTSALTEHRLCVLIDGRVRRERNAMSAGGDECEKNEGLHFVYFDALSFVRWRMRLLFNVKNRSFRVCTNG